MTTESRVFTGANGDPIDGYYARPTGTGPFPGVVIIHHIFGVDEWISEVSRRFAHHGYAALAPNLYSRIGDIGSGPPEEIAAGIRSKGGFNDDLMMGDVQGAVDALRSYPEVSDKVGAIGFCMGGRLAFLAGCKVAGLDAIVDCWGGGVAPDPERAAAMPGPPPIDFVASLSAPVLGIFGNDDRSPDRAEVDRTEAVLKAAGKSYEFHRYDGAGHAFFSWNSVAARPEQARDGWERIWQFYGRHLSVGAAAEALRG